MADVHPVSAAVSAPRWARPYEPVATAAAVATGFVAASTLGYGLLVLQGLAGPPITIPARDLLDVAAVVTLAGGSLLALLGLVGAAVAVPVWMYRCYQNLPALGSRGRLSPAWAAWGWFVPVANLVLPPMALSDVWATSGGSRGWPWPLLAAWWVAWLGAWAVQLGGSRLPHGSPVLSALPGLLMVLAGVLFVVIIHLITSGQRARASAAR